MSYVFISYSAKNSSATEKIVGILEKNGINTWIAHRDIPVGQNYASVINQAIKNCGCFLLFLTKESQESNWVIKEVEGAIKYGKSIISAKLDTEALKDEFEFFLSSYRMVSLTEIDSNSPIIKNLIAMLKKEGCNSDSYTEKTSDGIDYASMRKEIFAIDDCNKLTDCQKPPVPEYSAEQTYVFVSYCHDDYKDVYSDLLEFHKEGVRFWYDKALTAGKSWREEAKEKLINKNCAGVIFYLSENFVLSDAVITEINHVLGKNGEVKKPYFTISLSDALPGDLIWETLGKKTRSELRSIGISDGIRHITVLNEAFPDEKTNIINDSENLSHIAKVIKTLRDNFDVVNNSDEVKTDTAKTAGSQGEFVRMAFDNGDVYEGMVLNGKMHGSGKYTCGKGQFYGDVYIGDYKEGKRTGEGKYVFASGSVYEGCFVDGKFHGKGKYTQANGDVYEGDYVDGKRTGKGIYTFVSGMIYEGDFIDGKYHGNGKMQFPDGDIYEGNFIHGKRTGNGKHIFKNRDVYEGDFVDGIRVGKGKHTFVNGDIYEGDFVDGKFHGKGKMTYANGNICECEFVNGRCKGSGKLIYTDGSVYQGEISDGKRSGFGKYTNVKGIVDIGYFKDDKFVG